MKPWRAPGHAAGARQYRPLQAAAIGEPQRRGSRNIDPRVFGVDLPLDRRQFARAGVLGTAGKGIPRPGLGVDRIRARAFATGAFAVAGKGEFTLWQGMAFSRRDVPAVSVPFPPSYPGRWPSWPVSVLPPFSPIATLEPLEYGVRPPAARW